MTASFEITGSTLAFIYYVYGNIGMPPPLFPNVQNATFNQTLNYSNPAYGVNYITDAATPLGFTISDLTPGITYSIYFYIMNLNRVYQDQWYRLNFTTQCKKNFEY